MARGELVSKLRSSSLSNEHLDEGLIVVRVANHDLVNVSRDGRFISHRRVLVRDRCGLAREGVVIRIGWHLLVDVHIAGVDTLADARQAISLDNVVFLLGLAVVVQWRVRESVEST